MPSGFFDLYPAFYESSHTGAVPNRLNKRYAAVIEANKALLEGARVLDLASHDGRWAFAALQAGAAHVTGVEARRFLIEHAERIFGEHGIARERFELIEGEIFATLASRRFSQDVVFLLGFFYHTHRHVELLSLICRNRPKAIIIDTRVNADPLGAIRLHIESVEVEQNSIADLATRDGKTIVGTPSVAAIRFILGHWGYAMRQIDWGPIAGEPPLGVDDYAAGHRATIVAELR
jgi:hypothetical protein